MGTFMNELTICFRLTSFGHPGDNKMADKQNLLTPVNKGAKRVHVSLAKKHNNSKRFGAKCKRKVGDLFLDSTEDHFHILNVH